MTIRFMKDEIDFIEDEEDQEKLRELLRLPYADRLIKFIVYKLNKLTKKYLGKAEFEWGKMGILLLDYYGIC
jgi:hypothetical protein